MQLMEVDELVEKDKENDGCEGVGHDTKPRRMSNEETIPSLPESSDAGPCNASGDGDARNENDEADRPRQNGSRKVSHNDEEGRAVAADQTSACTANDNDSGAGQHSTAPEGGNAEPQDINDAIASIAAAMATASSTMPTETLRLLPPPPPKIDMKQSQKDSVIHTRDIKMTSDDALLGDVPWTEDQHKAFVAAIFEVGLKTCSPSVIMEQMRKHPKYVTRERTKSHLQKYRITKDKNKEDFLAEYSNFLSKTENVKHETIKRGKEPIPKVVLAKVLGGKKASKLIGGEAAALLSFSVMNNCSTDDGPDQIPFQGVRETFPKLTEGEKQTSLGASLLFVKGLLQNMTDVLLRIRHGIKPSSGIIGKNDDSSSSSEEEEEYPDEEEEEEEEVEKPLPMPVKSQKRKASTSSGGETSRFSPVEETKPHRKYNFRGPGPGPYPARHQPMGFPPPFARQGPPPGYPPHYPPPFFGGPPRPMPPPHHGPYPPPPAYNQGPYNHPPMNPYNHGRPPHYPDGPDASYSAYQGGPSPHFHQQNHPNTEYSQEHGGQWYPESGESYAQSYPDSEQPPKKKKKRWKLEGEAIRPDINDLGSNSESWDLQQSHKRDRRDTRRSSKRRSSEVSEHGVSKRKEMSRPSPPYSVEIAMLEEDQDRGIPGASKIASPAHGKPSPIKSKRGNYQQQNQRGHSHLRQEPSMLEQGGQSPLLLESPVKQPHQSTGPQQQTPPSTRNYCDKSLSPDMPMAQLSPGDLELTMSNDGHSAFWEPLAIDIHEHFMDQERLQPAAGEESARSHSPTKIKARPDPAPNGHETQTDYRKPPPL
mmetsp:Transcript_31763/g.53055  ORF Transcript_31763/g.53055 Transcript_31763/m.53055 type:complete len:818 (+) Transcript_31763:320-2773(+)